jgi:hypothetical protein
MSSFFSYRQRLPANPANGTAHGGVDEPELCLTVGMVFPFFGLAVAL